MKKNAVILPYDNSSYSLVKYELNEYKIVGCFAPLGWGSDKQKCSNLIGDSYDSLEVNSCNDNFETVIIVESEKKFNFKTFLFKVLENYKKNIKSICLRRTLSVDCFRQLKTWTEENQILLDCYHDITKVIDEDTLFEFSKPIIFVTGILKNSNKFLTQIELEKQFKQEGLKVSVIGTKGYSDLFGYNPFPSFVFEHDLTVSEKIYRFNHYIKNIEIKENPDVLIVGVPNEMMKINSSVVGDFGLTHFIVSNAVQSDSVVTMLPYGFNMTELDRIKSYIKGKYGYFIDAVILSNSEVEYQSTDSFKKEYYFNLEWDQYYERYSEISKYNVFDQWCLNGNLAKQIESSLNNDCVQELI